MTSVTPQALEAATKAAKDSIYGRGVPTSALDFAEGIAVCAAGPAVAAAAPLIAAQARREALEEAAEACMKATCGDERCDHPTCSALATRAFYLRATEEQP